jgi:Flp pilus assembly protein TadG
MNPRQRRQRGQSLVEFCFVLPIMLVMFMGVYTAGAFISDMDIAGQATRAGARLGA